MVGARRPHAPLLVLLATLALLPAAPARAGAASAPRPGMVPSGTEARPATLRGRLALPSARWGGAALFVFAAPFSGDEADGGMFTYDAEQDRSAAVGSDGSFRLADLPAGRYVLVVGPSAEEGVPVVDAQGTVRVFEAVPGGDRDLGLLGLDP